MTFSSIVRKNFTHNFNKYISFYFVNSLIIVMLFMYGSLIFNPIIINNIGKTSQLYGTVKVALIGVILFSIVFITYTNIAFLKNRGKEFGMYLTLGMTTRDLIKLIFVENLGIMVASLLTGILSGSLFGRLFYMGLNKMLVETNVQYKLDYKSFLLSIGIFALIFLGNFIFNMFYIRRVSIIDAIKSDKKKEVGKANILIGTISLVLLIIALYYLPKTLFKEIFKEQSYMIGVFVALILICLYMVIGSCIALVKNLLSKFPKLYNRNILVLSNLSHRFLAYKNILYMLSLLVAAAMFYVGLSYSNYSSVREEVSLDNPYDIMFLETNKYNKATKEEVENIIDKSDGKIEKYNVLEYIEVPIFKKRGQRLALYGNAQSVISETNYNKHMGTNVDIKPNEAIHINVDYFIVNTDEDNEINKSQHQSTILTTMNENQLEEIQALSAENNDLMLSKENYETIAGKSATLSLDEDNIKREHIKREKHSVPFINFRKTRNYDLGSAFVVDDKDYQVLKDSLTSDSINKVHLLNLKNGDKAFEELINYLRRENGLDNSYWNKAINWWELSNDERGDKESYRPTYKEEFVTLELESRGMDLFTMTFMGLLFIIANGICLYYKVLSDIQDEEERIISLNRIGILQKEVKSIISKEIAITFFIPILVGGGLGLYFLYILFSRCETTALLMKKSVVILLIGAIIQGIFYLISRKKYIKEVIR